jgi:starvation-inducible DNA-binding protein
MKGETMFETSHDLPQATRRSVIDLLNAHLADAIDLQLQAKQAHWNVKGPNFVGLHELFDKIAEQTREYAAVITIARPRAT